MPMSFEPGAPPSAGEIPLCIPHLSGNEWQYIQTCLETNYVSCVGPYVTRFEREVAQRVGSPFGVATVNGTAAIHIALLAAGIQEGDEVLVSTLTFVAPVNAIRYVGAWPVFIDAEPVYWQMDMNKVADFLTHECRWQDGVLWNKSSGRPVKAIMPVHILGHPCDMDPLVELARKYNLVIIEDATESLGATYKGTMVGALGDIACFSFNGNKIITTGGGGVIVTSREAWAKKAKYLTTQAKDDAVEFVHNEIGYNYRLSNILAAMGCAQLENLDRYIADKRRIAAAYSASFSNVEGIKPPSEASWAFSICWMYTVLIDPDSYGMTSRDLIRQLAAEGIQSRPLWRPMHRLPAHADCQAYHCDIADHLNSQAITLPCSVGLSEEDQDRVIHQVKSMSIIQKV